MTFLTRAALVLGVTGCTLFLIQSDAQAQAGPGGAAAVPAMAARASVRADVKQDDELGETKVIIRLQGAIPDHFYTVWIRLRDPDGSALPGKANPLTNTNSTPLAPTSAIADLLRETDLLDLADPLPLGVVIPPDHCSVDPLYPFAPLCVGTTDLINGFFTNSAGNGMLEVTLNFLLSDGVYPWHKFEPGLPDAEIKTLSDEAGGTLRIVSHLTDNLGHGLKPGKHEVAFDLLFPSVLP
ncbi:MAG: hypothetical protein ACE5NA_11865 [Nitrospiraceae bacterium]